MLNSTKLTKLSLNLKALCLLSIICIPVSSVADQDDVDALKFYINELTQRHNKNVALKYQDFERKLLEVPLRKSAAASFFNGPLIELMGALSSIRTTFTGRDDSQDLEELTKKLIHKYNNNEPQDILDIAQAYRSNTAAAPTVPVDEPPTYHEHELPSYQEITIGLGAPSAAAPSAASSTEAS